MAKDDSRMAGNPFHSDRFIDAKVILIDKRFLKAVVPETQTILAEAGNEVINTVTQLRRDISELGVRISELEWFSAEDERNLNILNWNVPNNFTTHMPRGTLPVPTQYEGCGQSLPIEGNTINATDYNTLAIDQRSVAYHTQCSPMIPQQFMNFQCFDADYSNSQTANCNSSDTDLSMDRTSSCSNVRNASSLQMSPYNVDSMTDDCCSEYHQYGTLDLKIGNVVGGYHAENSSVFEPPAVSLNRPPDNCLTAQDLETKVVDCENLESFDNDTKIQTTTEVDEVQILEPFPRKTDSTNSAKHFCSNSSIPIVPESCESLPNFEVCEVFHASESQDTLQSNSSMNPGVMQGLNASSKVDVSHRESSSTSDTLHSGVMDAPEDRDDEKRAQSPSSVAHQHCHELINCTNCHKDDSDDLQVLHVVGVREKHFASFSSTDIKKITVGTRVYAMTKDLYHEWRKAIVISVTNNTSVNVRYLSSNLDQTKLCLTKELAHITPPNALSLTVKRRVIAFYHTDIKQQQTGIYAGVIGELPKMLNKFRYLVFFDDGFTQYVHLDEIRLIYHESVNFWEDVHVDNRDFIKNYFENYPEVPMLKLKLNQSVGIRQNSLWRRGKVVKLDASLARIQCGKKREWIYRGSNRLKIFRPESGNNKRIPQIKLKDEDLGERQVSNYTNERCSTLRSLDPEVTSVCSLDELAPMSSTIITSSRIHSTRIFNIGRKKYVEHICNEGCRPLDEEEKILQHRQENPLLVPIHIGWQRLVTRRVVLKRRTSSNVLKLIVVHRTPCGRFLRNIEELRVYLGLVKSNIDITFFAFDPEVMSSRYYEVPKEETLFFDPDISRKKEALPIPCVNDLSSESFPPFEYSSSTRYLANNVFLNKDEEFLCGCNCTDDCQDWTKCECQRLTHRDKTVNDEPFQGYKYKRLKQVVDAGIYECNAKCRCNKLCMNRVVQKGVRVRLQVFKTENKGWGIRCIDDLEAGTYICTYVGQLITDKCADKDPDNAYYTSLDLIEVAEKGEEGYESKVDHPENEISASSCIGTTNARNGSYSKESLRMTKRPPISSIKRKLKDGTSCSSPIAKSTRYYFGAEEECIVIDAKTIGNVARFFNHSCSPNVFVQNVFIDTHDLRFPEVAFFSSDLIVAGTELTWDYKYNVGSIPGKCLDCFCMSTNCRGRLL